MKNNDNNKVIIIGFDGATYDLIKPWVKKGYLPNFFRLMEEGTHGILKSTIPPMSPPAWTSAITGKNPGKHGVFAFINNLKLEINKNDQSSFVTSYNRQAAPVWTILSNMGKKVGIINIPMTFPPDEVNGFMIAGFPYFSEKSYVYPEDLIDKIPYYKIEEFGEGMSEGEEEDYLNHLYEVERNRQRAALELMRSEDVDLLWVVFVGADRVSHFFWKHMDETHPMHDQEKAKIYGDVIRDYYIKMDNILGDFLAELDDNTSLIVISDHGFGPVYNGIEAKSIITDRMHGLCDQDNCKIYYNDLFGGTFYVNLKGREVDGVVDPSDYEIVREDFSRVLKELKDPKTDKNIISSVFKKEDVYYGPYLHYAPDIICLESEGNTIYPGAVKKDANEADDTNNLPYNFSGFHRENGIFLIKGKDVKASGVVKGACIQDIAPTIFYILGLPVPDDMDGNVIIDAFDEAFIKRNPVTYQKIKEKKKEKPEEIRQKSKSAAEEIERQLRALGYME